MARHAYPLYTYGKSDLTDLPRVRTTPAKHRHIGQGDLVSTGNGKEYRVEAIRYSSRRFIARVQDIHDVWAPVRTIDTKFLTVIR